MRARLGLTFVSLALAVAGCNFGRQKNPAGGELYARYCASCHGDDGRGGGPAAAALDPRPTDLTASKLSLTELMRSIDGRKGVAAHGTSAMPVWAEVFAEDPITEPSAKQIAALRLKALAEHVRSLRKSP